VDTLFFMLAGIVLLYAIANWPSEK